MESINDFVRERIRQCGLPRSHFQNRFPVRSEELTRRGFLRGAGAVIAFAAAFSAMDAALSPYANAANAVVYVDSGAGGANNGTSWANAYTTWAAAVTASGTTGTDFYIKNTHSEALSAAISCKGADATPDRAFSCDATNSPPQTSDLLAGASFTSATSTSISLSGNVYIFGISGAAGSGASNTTIVIGNTTAGITILDTCTLSIASTGGSGGYSVGAASGNGTVFGAVLINTTIQFAAAGQSMFSVGSTFKWYNTPSVIQGATLPTTLISTGGAGRFANWYFDSVDLSALSSKTIIASANVGQFQAIDCKLPATVTLASAPGHPGVIWDFITSDSTAVNSSSFIQTRFMYQGTLTADNAVYNNATDGVNPISWKVVATANATPQAPFECFEIVQWAAAGTYAASKIALTSATAALTNNDVWVDVEYLGTSGNPQGLKKTTGNSPQLPQGSSPTALTTAGASWATGGAGNNYTLAIPSFTTTLAGYVRLIVKIGKPSLTVWVDPNATIA